MHKIKDKIINRSHNIIFNGLNFTTVYNDKSPTTYLSKNSFMINNEYEHIL